MWLIIFSSRIGRGSFFLAKFVQSMSIPLKEKKKMSLFFIIAVCNKANYLWKHKNSSSKTCFLCSVWMFANVHVCVLTICTKHVCCLMVLTSLSFLLLMHTCTLIQAVSEAGWRRRGVPVLQSVHNSGFRGGWPQLFRDVNSSLD